MGIKSDYPLPDPQARWETKVRKQLADAKGPPLVKASSPRIPRNAALIDKPVDAHKNDAARKARIKLARVSILEKD